MKRLALLPLLALPAVALAPVAASAATPMAPLVSAQGSAATGQYIVTVKSGASHREHALGEAPKGAVTHVFKHVVNGFSARLDASQLSHLRSDPNVVKVTQASYVHTEATPVRPGLGPRQARRRLQGSTRSTTTPTPAKA